MQVRRFLDQRLDDGGQRLTHADVGVVELDVFADDAYRDLFLRSACRVDNTAPTAQIALTLGHIEEFENDLVASQNQRHTDNFHCDKENEPCPCDGHCNELETSHMFFCI